MTTRKHTHYTQLGPSAPNSPVAEEWETYRRIAGDLLATGYHGQFVLIKGSEVIGFWPTFRDAHSEGVHRYPGQPMFIQEVREWEPVYNFGWLTFGKLLEDGDRPCHV